MTIRSMVYAEEGLDLAAAKNKEPSFIFNTKSNQI